MRTKSSQDSDTGPPKLGVLKVLSRCLAAALAIGAIALVVAFAFVPVLSVLVRAGALSSWKVWTRFSDSPGQMDVLGNTIRLGLLTALTCTVSGFVLALVQVRTAFRWKKTLHVLAITPIVAPPFIVSMSIITVFGRSGLISNSLLGIRHDVTGLEGLLLATTISFMPVAYLSFIGMLYSLDGTLEEASANLGAGLIFRLRTVVLPLLAPGIVGSALLVFSTAVSDLGSAIIVGGDYDVLSERIYLAVVGEYDLDRASVLCVLLLVPSLLAFAIQYFWLRNREHMGLRGRIARPVKLLTQRRLTWPLYAVTVTMMALIALLYGYVVVGTFTKVWNIDFEPTLEHVRYVAQGAGREALADTLILALISTPISGLAGLAIAAVVSKKPSKWRGLLDFLTLLGVAVPGVMIGLGLILVYNTDHLAGALPRLNGSASLIVIAFTVRSLPGVVRAAIGALNQLSQNIEEASITLGATTTQTFFMVVLPLIRPAVFASLVWSFTRSMTTLTPIVFLVTPRWRVMTEQILREADQGRYNEAAAYSFVLVSVVLAALALLWISNGVRRYVTAAAFGQLRPRRVNTFK